MHRVTGLSICLLVLVISLEYVKARWIGGEQMVESSLKYKYPRDSRSTYTLEDSQRLPSHFINLERLKKQIGIAGLDNMDIMTTILKDVRHSGGSFNLRRKGESSNPGIVVNDLRKLLESNGKR